MIQLSEPQIWTVIGIFGASTVGTIGLISTWFMRVMNAGFAGLQGQVGGLQGQVGGLQGRIGGLESRIGGLEGQVGGLQGQVGGLEGRINGLLRETGGLRQEMGGLRREMAARFDAQNVKLDYLGRDVQTLKRRVFPEYPEAG